MKLTPEGIVDVPRATLPSTVVVAWRVALEVTFSVPPICVLPEFVTVLPDAESVEVPERAPVVFAQNGKLPEVIAELVDNAPPPVLLPVAVMVIRFGELVEIEIPVPPTIEVVEFESPLMAVMPPPPDPQSEPVPETMPFMECRHCVPVTLVIVKFVVVALPLMVVDAKETRPPDCVRVEAKVAVPVTFTLPPTLNALAWVMVVPLTLKVDVPESAPAVVAQNGKLLAVIAELVVTEPEPPPVLDTFIGNQTEPFQPRTWFVEGAVDETARPWMPTTVGDDAVFPRSPAIWGIAKYDPPLRDDSRAWLELAQRISLPEEPVGQVPSASWMEPAPVEDSTMGPRNVVVALKVWAPVQVLLPDVRT